MKRDLSQLRSRHRSNRTNNIAHCAELNPNYRRLSPLRKWLGRPSRQNAAGIPVRWLVAFLLALLAIGRHFLLFYHLMENNLVGTCFHKELMSHNLVDILVDQNTFCPQLPWTLVKFNQPHLVPMTKEELEQQVGMMISINHTGSNIVLQCPHPTDEHYGEGSFTPPCRGVVKVYRSESIYQHVKRCLKLLADSAITARLLYSDDETLTMVEEEIASSTLWQAPIPKNFEIQLLYIRCILLKYSVVHRDLTAANFVVDSMTGKIYIIDLSDAFVWDDQWLKQRNLVNLFNIWWKWHDEDAQRHTLVKRTKRNGYTEWKRPAVPRQEARRWEPSEQDLKLLGGRQRFDLVNDINIR